MNKKYGVLIMLVCVLVLSGCNNKKVSTEKVDKSVKNEGVKKDTADTGITDEVTEEKKDLTDAEIEAAKQAALEYYKNTVFEVNSMDILENGNKICYKPVDCSFSVNVSKDGVVQEPNRMIFLTVDENNLWKVESEGY